MLRGPNCRGASQVLFDEFCAWCVERHVGRVEAAESLQEAKTAVQKVVAGPLWQSHMERVGESLASGDIDSAEALLQVRSSAVQLSRAQALLTRAYDAWHGVDSLAGGKTAIKREEV